MLDRRTLAALVATAPFAGPIPRLDIPDPRIEPLNTEDAEMFGISPDASVLVGKGSDHRIVFLDADTRFPISESDAVPELLVLPETTVSWSPNGDQIAFDLQAWLTQRDSDIFTAGVTSGAVTNLTPENHENEADSLMDELVVQIDVSPVWLDDDTILFARHRMDDPEDLQCELCTINVSTGMVDTFLNLVEFGIAFVTSKMWRLSDGSFVFLADFRGREIRRGAVLVSPDGSVSDVHPGLLETTNYISVNDTHLIAFDAQDFAWWYLSLDESMTPTPLWEHFPLPDGWTMAVEPILGPEPDSMFTVLRTDHDKLSAQLYSSRTPFELGELEGKFGRSAAHWAEGYILIAGKTNSWLVSQRGPGL